MKEELELWSNLSHSGTVWLFHDTHMWGHPNPDGMVEAIREFAEREGWRYEDYRKQQHGLGRMTRGEHPPR